MVVGASAGVAFVGPLDSPDRRAGTRKMQRRQRHCASRAAAAPE
jgi:hypothetical protein